MIDPNLYSKPIYDFNEEDPELVAIAASRPTSPFKSLSQRNSPDRTPSPLENRLTLLTDESTDQTEAPSPDKIAGADIPVLTKRPWPKDKDGFEIPMIPPKSTKTNLLSQLLPPIKLPNYDSVIVQSNPKNS